MIKSLQPSLITTDTRDKLTILREDSLKKEAETLHAGLPAHLRQQQPHCAK